MIIEWISSNAAILLASLAIVATIRSNIIAHKAKKLSIKIHGENKELVIYKQRTEILEEIDKQQALLNRFSAINTKLLSEINNPEALAPVDRRLKNQDVINKLRSDYDEQRSFANKIDKNSSIDENEKNLSEIRRLSLFLEKEIENELMNSHSEKG